MNSIRKYFVSACFSLLVFATATTAAAQASGTAANSCDDVTEETCKQRDHEAECCEAQKPKTVWNTEYVCSEEPAEALPRKTTTGRPRRCECGNPEYVPVESNELVPSKPAYTSGNTTHRFYTKLVVCMPRDPGKRTSQFMTEVNGLLTQFRAENQQSFADAFAAADAAAAEAKGAKADAAAAMTRANEAWSLAVQNGQQLLRFEGILGDHTQRIAKLPHWMVAGGWTVVALPGGSVVTGPSLMAGHRAGLNNDNSLALDVSGSLTASSSGMNKETYGEDSGSMAVGTLSVEASIALGGKENTNPARLRVGAMGVQTWRMNTPKGVDGNHAVGVGPSLGVDIPLGDTNGIFRPSVAAPYTFVGNDDGLGFVGQVGFGLVF